MRLLTLAELRTIKGIHHSAATIRRLEIGFDPREAIKRLQMVRSK
jgi:hypothetical protein